MPSGSKISSFLQLARPFVSINFWRLNARTLQIKWTFRNHKNRLYTEYLQYYYSRNCNPYYETIEDKWRILRPLIIAMAALAPEERVLDLGTGIGFQASAFAEKGYQTLGIDLVLDRVTLAKERQGCLNLCWSVADATRLPLSDNSFDVVAVSLMLHDMPISALRSALTEIRRVARRRVVIAEPHLPKHWLFRIVYRSVIALLDESLYLHEYLDTNIEFIFKETGLHLVKREHCIKNTLAIYACDV